MLAFLPSFANLSVCELSAELIEFADGLGENRWSVSSAENGFKINIGWTESLVVDEQAMYLLVDGEVAPLSALPESLTIHRGSNPKGYRAHANGSVVVVIPFVSLGVLQVAINLLKPALFKAASLIGRWPTTPTERASHDDQLVMIFEEVAGRNLPSFVRGSRQTEKPIREDGGLMEGALKRVVSSIYERNPVARAACIKHYGATCVVCNFSFEASFGDIGRGFIHVHHLVPLAATRRSYRVDPIADLRPVCPNCHAMLHSNEVPIEIEVLKKLLKTNS